MVNVDVNPTLTHGVGTKLVGEVLFASTKVGKAVFEVLRERGNSQTSKDLLTPIVSVNVALLTEDEIFVFEVTPARFVSEEVLKLEQIC